MAKQRLVDFRGGINTKVSPHMIGDSQGQDAVEIDFSTVRLQGRNTLSTLAEAEGSFLYDPGDGSGNAIWVSIYPSDANPNHSVFNPYIEFASDFAVWNRDLYVATGATVKLDSNGDLAQVDGTEHSGQTVRYLDGIASGPSALNFDPPSAVTIEFSDPGWNTEVVPEVPELTAPDWSGQTGTVTTQATDTTNYTLINHNEWRLKGATQQYSQSRAGTEEAAAGGRDYYTRTGDNTKYYAGLAAGNSYRFNNEVEGTFYKRFNDTIQSSVIYITTLNNQDLSTTATGDLQSARNINQQSFHGVDINNVSYYTYSTDLPKHANSTNNLSNSMYGKQDTPSNLGTPILVGTPTQQFMGVDFNTNGSAKTVTESNYTDLGTAANPYSRLDGSTVPYYLLDSTGWTDPQTGTSTQQFNVYRNNTDTQDYYAPQSPLQSPYTGLTVGNFYTQSGTSGSTSETPPSAEYGWNWYRRFTVEYNSTFGSETYWMENANTNLLSIYVDGDVAHQSTGISSTYKYITTGTYAGFMYVRGTQITSNSGITIYRLNVYDNNRNDGWLALYFNGSYVQTIDTTDPSEAGYLDTTTGITIGSWRYNRGSKFSTTRDYSSSVITQEAYKITDRVDSTVETVQWEWERNVTTAHTTYSTSNTGDKWFHYLLGSDNNLLITYNGASAIFSGTSTYASNPNQPQLQNGASDYNYCYMLLADGTVFSLDTSSAYMEGMVGSDLANVIAVKFELNSNHQLGSNFSANTPYFVDRGSAITTSSSPSGTYYAFNERHVTNGTLTLKNSTGTTTLTTISNQPVATSSYTAGGWDYERNTSLPATQTPTNLALAKSTESQFIISYVSTTASRSQTIYSNYTYTAHTRNEARQEYFIYPTTQAYATQYYFPATMYYQVWTDTLPTVDTVPSTDAFTYDDARSEIYQQNTASGTPATINDESRGDNWLAEGRALSGPDVASAYGYFIKTVRGSSGFPELSTNEVRASVSSTSATDIMQTDALHTPQRIDFDSITDPTDVTDQNNVAVPPDGYRLYRKDNGGTIDLGYIKPSSLDSSYTTDITFSFSTSTKKITISNLKSASNYRLKWWAYQQSRVKEIVGTTTSTGTSFSSKSNTTGFSFTGETGLTVELELSTSGDARMYACDFWLEESILDGSNTSSLLDNTYAVIKCYDVLYDTAYDNINAGDSDSTNDDAQQTIDGTCDFLDLFASSLLSDGLGSSSSVTTTPDFCKFFRESNNFFFAVGTSFTNATFYGGSSNTNKKGSYLFVSEYNDPTTWHSTGYVQFDSEITGLHTYPGELIVWTENGTYRVTGSRYDQMRKTKLATTEGMLEGQYRTAVLVNNYLVWLSQSGICIYDGRGVTNLTRGRFEDFGFTSQQKRHPQYDLSDAVGTGLHAGQYEGIYYLLGSDETGYAVDFNLEGFPITKVDLKEGNPAQTATVPVLVYSPQQDRLYSRNGIIAQGDGTNSWTYKTREFDGGAFGSLKLVKSIILNGQGSGQVQIYLDNQAVFSSPRAVDIAYSNTTQPVKTTTQPVKIYVPANPSGNIYGLAVADVWSVEIIDWSGRLDWIDTEYEVVST